MENIKIYYNGFRIGNDKTLVKANLSIGSDGIVHMYGCHYQDLPRGYGFGIHNDTDIMTDYFENDSAYVGNEHPLYKYLRYAALKANYLFARRWLKKYGNETDSYFAEHIKHHQEAVDAFLNEKDPGQPTKEDLAAVQSMIEKAAAEKKAAEEKAEDERAAKAMIEELETEITINTWVEKYPVVEGRAIVKVPFSERRGIKKDSVWSLRAAQFIFRDLDEREHAKHEGYDKTDFVITWTDDFGDNTYNGRYDIGDGEGGLLEHLYNYAEYFRTHDQFGHLLDNPPATTDNLELFKRIVKAS